MNSFKILTSKIAELGKFYVQIVETEDPDS